MTNEEPYAAVNDDDYKPAPEGKENKAEQGSKTTEYALMSS